MKTLWLPFVLLLALCGVATAQLGPLGGVLPTFSANPSAAPTFSCTGGTVTTSGTSQINTFAASGTLVCTGNGTINYLVVAGGGGGGGGPTFGGGGGGAGGFRTGALAIVAGTYPVVVGFGGTGGTTASAGIGSHGVNSSVFGIVSTGGGGGGYQSEGVPGGSGGGGSPGTGITRIGGFGSVNQGSDGGAGIGTTTGGGGGGGCGFTGGNSSGTTTGGVGGAGCSSNLSGFGLRVYSAGGGAGGIPAGQAGDPLAGGGCNLGGCNGFTANPNRGGGGGGGLNEGTQGGSGIIIVSYPIPSVIPSGGCVGAADSTTGCVTPAIL